MRRLIVQQEGNPKAAFRNVDPFAVHHVGNCNRNVLKCYRRRKLGAE